MSLFEIQIDQTMEYARETTPIIDFLDRCPRKSINKIRDTLDSWFHHYPDNEKERLRSDFRSKSNREHISAFFELYMHEFLLRHGYSIKIHNLEESGRSKDYTILRDSRIISVEATVSTNKKTEERQKHITTQLIEYINQNAFVPGFRYFIDEIQEGTSLPSLTKIAKLIREWVKQYDRKTLRQLMEKTNFRSMPSKHIKMDNWEFNLQLIPRPHDEPENLETRRSIGIGPIESGWQNDDRSLKNSLRNKAKHYKDKSKPYIIAVNTWFNSGEIDEIDIFNALLGSEVVQYSINPINQVKAKPGRLHDGLWFGPRGAQNRHVSGILVFSNLLPWTIHTALPTLYLHPKAKWPIKTNDFQANTVTWDTKTGELKKKGNYSENIFGIPESWLENN